MKFGIFDYIDLRSEPLTRTYDERMILLQAAESLAQLRCRVRDRRHTDVLSFGTSRTTIRSARRFSPM